MFRLAAPQVFRPMSVLLACLFLLCGLTPIPAQDGPLGFGWDLRPESSVLRFQSVKQSTKVESSSFATLSGSIEPDGSAELHVALDSVDTKIDLRNVRMRFMLFETFKFPEAVIALKIDAARIADLSKVRRKLITVAFTLDLHGVAKPYEAEIAVTLIDADTVSVSSSVPISISTTDHGLDDGVQKLQEAANVVIVPSATVTFDLLYTRRQTAAAPALSVIDAAAEAPASAALEATGDFSREACVGRFEILSRSGNIFFRPASALLDAASRPLLEQVLDIVKRCPELAIEVSGHTDSDGSDATNQVLSEARAAAVATYLTDGGIAVARIRVVGFGEAKPFTPNDTAEGKSRNRRIEFAVVN